MINVEAGRLREPAAWLMVAVASASVLVGIERLLFGGSGFGSPSFSTRAAIHLGTFTSPVTVALLVGAVLLATHLGPVIARLRHLALAVAVTLGLSVLFGLIGLLGGLLGGATGAREKIELLLVHLPSLALVAVALLYVLPRAIPAASAAGGPRGEGVPGHPRGAQDRHHGHDRPHGPGYGPVPTGEQGPFSEQRPFQGPGPNPSREHAPYPGAPSQGGPYQGGPAQGAPFQGAPAHGGPAQGAPFQGTPEGRDPRDGYGHPQGAPVQGAHPQGPPVHGTVQGAAHPPEHFSQQGFHPQDRPAQEMPPVTSPHVPPYGRPALPPAPAHASTGAPAAESAAEGFPTEGLPSEGYDRHPSAQAGDGPSWADHRPQAENRPHTEDQAWPGRLRTPEQQARTEPRPPDPLSDDSFSSSPRLPDPLSSAPVPGGPLSSSDPVYGRTDPQDPGRRADPPGWQEAPSPGLPGRHSEPQAQGTGWAEAQQPGYGQHHSGPRLPDPLSDDSFSSGSRPQDPLSDDSFSTSPRLPDPLSSAPVPGGPLSSSDPVYGRTDPQNPGWATDTPLYEHRAEQGQGGPAPAGHPEGPGWDPPSYGRQEQPSTAGSSGWYPDSPAPASDPSGQWSPDRPEQGHRGEQGHRAETHGYPEPQGYSRPESEDHARPDLQGLGHRQESQGFGQQGPYTPGLQAAAPQGQGTRHGQQAPDGPAGVNPAPDDVSASPFEDRPSPFGAPPASPFGDRAPNSFPTPPENYGAPAPAPGADLGYPTAPDLHYPTPDPVDPRSQQMAQAYQQAKNYQQTRGGEPPLRVPEYGTSGYGDPFGHPQSAQTSQVSQHPEAQHAQNQHAQNQHAQNQHAQNQHAQNQHTQNQHGQDHHSPAQPSQDRYSPAQPAQDHYSEAQSSPASQYPPRDEQRWDAPSGTSEATLRFDPAAYRDDPLGAPAPPVPPPTSAPAPAPERWDSQPIDPTAIYRPEQRRAQVTDEETPDTEKVGPGQDQNISWYGSDRRER